ncbi:hypothetical protein D3C86_1439180 [compost metagenome]
MIIARLSSLEEYRLSVRSQNSWMQRGERLFVLEIKDQPYSGSWYPTGEQQDQFQIKADEVYAWIRGQGIEQQTTPWRNFYSMPNKATSMRFKLTFC